MYIAENLKRLRRARDLTQEDVAEVFNVTFQTVSRWERGECYPDMELIPGLAAYFEITTDELFGMDEIRGSERRKEYNAESWKNWQSGRFDDNIALHRRALRDFPGDADFTEYLAALLFLRSVTTMHADKDLLREIIALYEYVLRVSRDDKLRLKVKSSLCQVYAANGEEDKARAMAEELPMYYSSQEMVMPPFGDEAERLQTYQMRTQKWMIEMLSTMLCLTEFTDVYTPEQRVGFYELSIKVYELLLDERDLAIHGLSLAKDYMCIARIVLPDGDTERALDCLEKAVGYAIAYANLPRVQPYVSPVFNRLKHDEAFYARMSDVTAPQFVLNYTAMSEWDGLRDNARYIAAVGMLESQNA